ncbi:hypothetical protein Ahy_A07g036940 isoform B [Arachis hypogaea]|nr:hypothetical protein Ahy_A07g036940 isoform B [Arachis hypogaea]
MAPAKP